MRILSVFGTRPEAIKMAPLIHELAKYPDRAKSVVCVTAQHRQMLDQVLSLFDIRPDIDLDLMTENQSPASVTAKVITALTEVLKHTKPDCVLVQGDTTTAMVAALASFYEKIPVGHIEAGLRTKNRYSPFPEEMNRRLISYLASYHFAPTRKAASALRAEDISEGCIFITGNTVVDAVRWIVSRSLSSETQQIFKRLGISQNTRSSNSHQKTILVTAHRRENFGRALENICGALKEIVKRNPNIRTVYPVHMNPNVRESVFRLLAGQPRIYLLDPLPYESFIHLMNASHLVLTDSGGIQEEAPALGKPVLVLRQETERREAVDAGTVKVVGVERESIVRETERLLSDDSQYLRMARAVSPYGDGHAAEHILSALLSFEEHGVFGSTDGRRNLVS